MTVKTSQSLSTTLHVIVLQTARPPHLKRSVSHSLQYMGQTQCVILYSTSEKGMCHTRQYTEKIKIFNHLTITIKLFKTYSWFLKG